MAKKKIKYRGINSGQDDAPIQQPYNRPGP